jgi:hypothetical protein
VSWRKFSFALEQGRAGMISRLFYLMGDGLSPHWKVVVLLEDRCFFAWKPVAFLN